MAIRRFPKGNEGKTQTGLPLGNPVCLWQTELFKLNLKSSPSSSGYNRRRRLATRSSGKQQAERTAVRAAPIVCSEESPLPASVYDNYAVRRFAAGGLVRRLWLGRGIWCPMGFSPASVPEGFQRTSGKPFGEPAGAYPLPRVETDAPTTAREWDLPSYGALTLFFRWRKKRVQKKASGTATTGKSPLLPILTAGLATSRAI